MGHYKKLKYLVTGFHEIAVLNILQISLIIVWWSVSLVPVRICCLQLSKKYFTMDVLLRNVMKHFERQFVGKFFAGDILNNS